MDFFFSTNVTFSSILEKKSHHRFTAHLDLKLRLSTWRQRFDNLHLSLGSHAAYTHLLRDHPNSRVWSGKTLDMKFTQFLEKREHTAIRTLLIALRAFFLEWCCGLLLRKFNECYTVLNPPQFSHGQLVLLSHDPRRNRGQKLQAKWENVRADLRAPPLSWTCMGFPQSRAKTLSIGNRLRLPLVRGSALRTVMWATRKSNKVSSVCCLSCTYGLCSSHLFVRSLFLFFILFYIPCFVSRIELSPYSTLNLMTMSIKTYDESTWFSVRFRTMIFSQLRYVTYS